MESTEHWTSGQFVPFSPRHAVQQEVDVTPQFLDYSASQQAADFHSVDVGHYLRSQQNSGALGYIANAISMVLEDLQSSAANTCASRNATVHDDEDSKDNSTSVKKVSYSEYDSDTVAEAQADSSFDIDCSTSHEQIRHRDLEPSCDQTNSASKMLVVEDWLANNSVTNISNACLPRLSKSSKVKHDANAQNLGKKHSKNVRLDVPASKDPAAEIDTQSFCAQQHSSSHQLDNTKVKRQPSKSKSCHSQQNTSIEKNQKLSNSSKESVAKSWQVQNVSKRCSLFEYKEEILHQQIPIHRQYALQQVSVLDFFSAVYWFIFMRSLLFAYCGSIIDFATVLVLRNKWY